jgi:hypothetical protein
MCIEWVICVLSRYRELRVSVKIQAGSLGNCLVINRIVWCMAVSSALFYCVIDTIPMVLRCQYSSLINFGGKKEPSI